MFKLSQIIITIIVLHLSHSLSAQNLEKQKQYHISATVFDEHIAIPFEVRKDAPTHLGGSLAFEMSRKRDGIYQFAHIFQVGYYYHADFNQVAFLAWKPKFELRFANTFSIHAILGIGYAHSFPVRRTYKLDNETYKKERNLGKPHAIPSIGFGAGFHLDKLLSIPIEIFGRYEMFSLAPYALKGRIPLTINTMLSLGVKVSL